MLPHLQAHLFLFLIQVQGNERQDFTHTCAMAWTGRFRLFGTFLHNFSHFPFFVLLIRIFHLGWFVIIYLPDCWNCSAQPGLWTVVLYNNARKSHTPHQSSLSESFSWAIQRSKNDERWCLLVSSSQGKKSKNSRIWTVPCIFILIVITHLFFSMWLCCLLWEVLPG